MQNFFDLKGFELTCLPLEIQKKDLKILKERNKTATLIDLYQQELCIDKEVPGLR